MNPKKIGGFLKELRKEKGLTQEQLAEILGVSGRTVSRWETGTNMPDLSILIQMADYYDVELKEILDGERKSEIMDKELKETLFKVADYSEMEKEKAAKAGNMAFGIMFTICAAMILIQLVIIGDLCVTLGETIALVAGGAVYIGIMVHNGAWENGSKIKSTPISDALISLVCSGIFSIGFAAYLINAGAEKEMLARTALVFFAGIGILGFGVLRVLAFFSKKRRECAESANKPIKKKMDVQPIPVFTADGSMQADMVIEALGNNHIAAYKQDLGTAGFSDARYGMGRFGDDRVVIYVAEDKADSAKQIIHEMGL